MLNAVPVLSAESMLRARPELSAVCVPSVVLAYVEGCICLRAVSVLSVVCHVSVPCFMRVIWYTLYVYVYKCLVLYPGAMSEALKC
jgi:hypothetical protein